MAGPAATIEVAAKHLRQRVHAGADLPESIDLVLLDGAKVPYSPVLDLLEPHLRPGSLVIADNVDMAPNYLARIRGGNSYPDLPFDDDVELSMRL